MRKHHRTVRRYLGEEGFTLTEILVVLSVFILMFSLSSSLFPNFLKNQETEGFFRQLSDDIYFAQSYAISHQQYIEVTIQHPPGESGGKYYINHVLQAKLLERNIPKDIKFIRGTMDLRILFAPNGNITSSGVWNVNTSTGRYKMTFNIGKGRFRIEKL